MGNGPVQSSGFKVRSANVIVAVDQSALCSTDSRLAPVGKYDATCPSRPSQNDGAEVVEDSDTDSPSTVTGFG